MFRDGIPKKNSSPVRQRDYRVISRLFVAQSLVVVIAAGGFSLIGPRSALSALAGGLICILPGLYFAFRLFSCQGAQASRKIVQNFYRGEAGKFLMTAILFAVVFVSMDQLDMRALFGTFIVAQLTYWLTPFMLTEQTKLMQRP